MTGDYIKRLNMPLIMVPSPKFTDYARKQESMNMSQLIIVGLKEVLDTLKQRSVAAVLSIENPDDTPQTRGYAPRLGDRPQKVLRFWDAEQKVNNGPDLAQIKEGIAFVLEHLEQGDVLIHCHAGKSRSVAIALGVLAQRHPEEDEARLLEKLLEIRPVAAPNIVIVGMVDALAKRDGKLVKAVLEHPVIAAQRQEAEKSRQKDLRERPDLRRKLFPKKFPRL